MVDWYGRWTPEDDYTKYPAEKMCDCDRIAKRIMDDGYFPRTDIKNIVEMVLAYYDYDNDFNLDECFAYVEDSGGWTEFDYLEDEDDEGI